jgi:hypothetical protein
MKESRVIFWNITDRLSFSDILTIFDILRVVSGTDSIKIGDEAVLIVIS